MAFFSVDCTNPVAAIRFKYGQQTVDMNALAYKVRQTDDAVQVIALVDMLVSSDEVSYSKKNADKKWDKCEKPASPFPVFFEFHKKTYRSYVDKEWIDTEPTVYEQFACKWLSERCIDDTQYSGYISVAPIRPGTENDLLNFDESSPTYAKAEILRDSRISMNLVDEYFDILTNAEWPATNSFSGGKKFKTPAESLAEKIEAVCGVMKSNIEFHAPDSLKIPTDTQIRNACLKADGKFDNDMIVIAGELRDTLISFF